MFGLDYIVKDNRTEVAIPKYNNKVQNPDMFDKESQIIIPMKVLARPSMKGKEKSKSRCFGSLLLLFDTYKFDKLMSVNTSI